MAYLDATWGGSDSNSYVTLDWADTCIRAEVVDIAAWTAATPRDQEAALFQATIDIDSRQYVGAREYATQKLEFPRDVLADRSAVEVASTSSELSTAEARMQSDVKRATCHQAVWILQNSGRNKHAELKALGIQEVTKEVGPIRETFKYRAGDEQPTLCPRALLLLSVWMTGRRIVRA